MSNMTGMNGTKFKLVEDLKKEQEKCKNTADAVKIMEIMQKAEEGYYHDFESPLATPKIQLHIDLLALGLVEIDKKMQDGEYDD